MAVVARSAERTPEYELEKNRTVIEVLRKKNENMKRTLNLKGLSDAFVLEGQPAPRKKKKVLLRTISSCVQFLHVVNTHICIVNTDLCG